MENQQESRLLISPHGTAPHLWEALGEVDMRNDPRYLELLQILRNQPAYPPLRLVTEDEDDQGPGGHPG